MQIQRLTPDDVEQYRALMLEAYERHPQAFTSSVREREKLPLAWWAARLDGELDVLLGAFCEGRLLGIVGLAFELREKARHKATLLACMSPLDSAIAAWATDWSRTCWPRLGSTKDCAWYN